MKVEHTPTPWEIRRVAPNWIVIAQEGMMNSHVEMAGEDQDANSEFIVRACNAHDELVAACRLARYELNNALEGCVSEGCSESNPCSYCQAAIEAIESIDAAVKKAEGNE